MRRDKRMEDEGMAIVCLYIENRQKNAGMRGRCCRGLTGPDGMSNRDSLHLLAFLTPDSDEAEDGSIFSGRILTMLRIAILHIAISLYHYIASPGLSHPRF